MCCALWAAAAFAAPQPPPEKLTWQDLINHPERWPASTKLTTDLVFGPGDRIKAGTVCKIAALQGMDAQLILPDNTGVQVGEKQCDLLEGANAAWAKLTPEQRAVTADMIIRDPSLWPGTVTVSELQSFGRFQIKAGETLPVIGIHRPGEIGLYVKGQQGQQLVPMSMTDVIAQAREIATTPKEKRVGRVPALLKGYLTDLEAKPVDVKPAEHYIIYWSGSGCEWCAQYNAKFVEYYTKNLADRADVQVFSIPGDKQMAPFYAYAKKGNLSWPVLPGENLGVTLFLGELGIIQMPGIIVFNKDGKIVASTLRQRGNPLQTADGIVAYIDKNIVNVKK
jgi:hypothetical protein